MRCGSRKYGDKNQKKYYVYRFVWESMLPDDKVIDHINDDRGDNRLTVV